MLKRKLILVLFAASLYSCGQSDAVKKHKADDNKGKELTQEQSASTYESMCVLCHGKDGKRNYLGATDLSTSNMSFIERVEIISSGKGTMMPFAEKLNKQQIEAVALYLETLTK